MALVRVGLDLAACIHPDGFADESLRIFHAGGIELAELDDVVVRDLVVGGFRCGCGMLGFDALAVDEVDADAGEECSQETDQTGGANG